MPLATSPRRPSALTAQYTDARRVPARARLILLALLLFASGAAALVYQVLWVKQLSLIVGVDVYAVMIGVSAFFAGLALGNFLLGRWADRVARPFLLYALLELGVAALGIAATLALAGVAELFAALEAQVGVLAWALPFLLVGVPTFLMGGTLPVLIRSLVPQAGQIGAAGGRLYAAKIAGALLTMFALIPILGVRGAALAAAGINLAAAIGALDLDRTVRSLETASRSPELIRLASDARLALVLYSLAGGIALGYEIVWSQAVVQFLSTRSFAFAVVLATYLAGPRSRCRALRALGRSGA